MAVASTNDIVSVPISLALYRQLLGRHPDSPHTLIEDVLADFLERTASERTKTQRNRGAGVNWESLFLPQKTRLRTKHHGEYKYADVKGDQIVYDGNVFSSVAKAINYMRGGTQNNAWLMLEVLLPDGEKWVRAQTLR